MARRILVTGGAGFIGSHVVGALLAQGDEVIVLDDCSTGSEENLAPWARNSALSMVRGSICDEVLVDEVAAGVNGIIHLAAVVGVKRILDHQVNGIITNVRGTEAVLRAATAHGGVPVFLASSSEVYGKLERIPFREDDDSVLGPTGLHRWSYACSKCLDEFLALAYWRERQLPVVIGRFFNITGPRQSPHYGMVLPRFCAAAKANVPLKVHGDGRQSRSFLHVDDCVRAVLALTSTPAAVGQVVNIGGEREISMLDLAKLVLTVTGSSAPTTLIPYQEAYPQGGFEDLRRRVPDTTKIRRLIGWTPERDLESIIRDCHACVDDIPPAQPSRIRNVASDTPSR